MIDADGAKIIEFRGEDIPSMANEYSNNGKKVLGLTGEDLFFEYCLAENCTNMEIVQKLEWKDTGARFGKPALCLLGPKGKKLNELAKNLTVCISNKYKYTAEKYLKDLEKSFDLRKIYINGCVETGYAQGISDLVIDIVYSGRTMEKNGLEIYDKIQESDFVIISPKAQIKPKQSICAISKYTPPLEDRRGYLRLDFNENTLGCSPKVIEALKQITPEDISAYPEYGKFVPKFAQYLKIDPAQILLTNGSDEAIKLVMDVFLENEDEILIPVPTFRLFEIYAQMAGARISKIEYNPDLSFPAEKILKKIENNPKMIILVSPNNPTGTAISEKTIAKICEKAANSIVLLDEAYYQYCGKTGKEQIKKYPNLVILQTFSKAFGLAGLRLGYLMANRQLISALKKGASPYSVNTIALKAAQAAIEDTGFVEKYCSEITANRKYVTGELKGMNLEVIPSQANFILVKFGKKSEIIENRLKEKKILARNVGKYPLLEGFLRITIGTKEQCTQLLQAITEILGEKALIFDLDGVLVDVSGSYGVAVKKTVEFFTGKEPDFEQIQKFKEAGGNNNDWDLCRAIIEEQKVRVTKSKVMEKFQEIYENENLAGNDRLIIDPKLLETLQKKFKLAIFTGRPKKEALFTLEIFGISGYFDAVVTNDDIPEDKSKPDSFGLELAMRKLNVASAYYFGDSVDDIEASIRAWAIPIGVIPPAGTKNLEQLLIAKGAAGIIGNINQLSEVIK